MELVVDEDHVRLVAQEQAWLAIRQFREEDAARVTAAVMAGIDAYFKKCEITPEHWVYLRLQMQERKETWGIARRTAIGLILTAALVFGGQALWEKAAISVLAKDNQRQQHQRPAE